MDEANIKIGIRALYILNSKGYSLKKLMSEYPFMFADAKTSMDFLEFLNTYLVSDGKSKHSNTSI